MKKKEIQIPKGMQITGVRYLNGEYILNREGIDPKTIDWENVDSYVQSAQVKLKDLVDV